MYYVVIQYLCWFFWLDNFFFFLPNIFKQFIITEFLFNESSLEKIEGIEYVSVSSG